MTCQIGSAFSAKVRGQIRPPLHLAEQLPRGQAGWWLGLGTFLALAILLGQHPPFFARPPATPPQSKSKHKSKHAWLRPFSEKSHVSERGWGTEFFSDTPLSV